MGGSAFDQSPICAEGVVAVSFNMRLGVLGFFSHPSLSAESPTGSSGNQGLQDSVAVLKWVRDNIKAFGGDPARVTVGGLSAGGSAAAILLSIPEAMGLFHGVISISPAPIGIRSGLEPGVQGQYDAHTYGEMLSTGLGLGPDATTEDMRAVSVEALIGAQMGMEAMLMHVDLPFTPRVDGAVLPEPVFDRFGSGNTPNVPLLIGIAADEGALVGEAILDRMNRGDFSAHLKRLIGEGANEVIARYPHDGQTILKSPMAQFTTDWLFTANARGTADHWARAGHPAFLYFNAAAFPPDHPGAAMGSFHGYAFNNGAMNAIDWDPKGVFDPLSARMMRRLGSFIRTGDPNVGGLPVWEPYDRASDPYLHLDHDADTPSRGLRPGDLDPLQRAIETRGQ
jgi:para-nitrobenzyl esterase